MQPLGAQQGGRTPAQSAQGATPILQECSRVKMEANALDGSVSELQAMQNDYLRAGNVTNRDIDAKSAAITARYRELVGQVRSIKSNPEAGSRMHRDQVVTLDRFIRGKISAFQTSEHDFGVEVRKQQERQYRIVNPNATEAEVREATADGGDTQVFQQALLNSNRRGQAQSTLRNVQQRHDAIQQIEKTVMELAQLFQDLDAIVVQQEPMVQNIEQKAEDTNQNMVAANTEMNGAVKSARAARKKKWICLGIVGKLTALYRSFVYTRPWLIRAQSPSSLSLSSSCSVTWAPPGACRAATTAATTTAVRRGAHKPVPLASSLSILLLQLNKL
ncbi:t-SNARE [Neohortaea acidophila]|uniref:t-SNARE n=1 Tax=Neohortaea acidophila TaxID=245834 RepID=A0A6A6PVH8_9PEZI|nr:t-SNARE [Neohortaea acidophila]KAF2484012.1 t-SNARE [Neohortaea acidophila]